MLQPVRLHENSLYCTGTLRRPGRRTGVVEDRAERQAELGLEPGGRNRLDSRQPRCTGGDCRDRQGGSCIRCPPGAGPRHWRDDADCRRRAGASRRLVRRPRSEPRGSGDRRAAACSPGPGRARRSPGTHQPSLHRPPGAALRARSGASRGRRASGRAGGGDRATGTSRGGTVCGRGRGNGASRLSRAASRRCAVRPRGRQPDARRGGRLPDHAPRRARGAA